MNQKGFAHIILIIGLFILSAVGAAYFYSKFNQTSIFPQSLQKNSYQKSKIPVPTISVRPSANKQQSDTVPDLSGYKNLINEGEIYYLLKGKLYTLNTSSMISNEIKIGAQKLNDLVISNDGQYLFLTSSDSKIVIYNSVDKKEVLTSEEIGPSPRVSSSEDISPNYKYFLVTTSTCPCDVGLTLIDMNGKIIKQVTGNARVWSPDGTRFALGKGEFALDVLGLGPSPTNNSIYLVEVSEKDFPKLPLVKATNQVSYKPLKWFDNSTLIYQKLIYDKPFPALGKIDFSKFDSDYWMKIYENPASSLWKMNVTTKIQEKYSGTTEEKDYRVSYSPTKKWKIIFEQEGDRLVYYITNNSNNPKIRFDVQQAVWKPTL